MSQLLEDGSINHDKGIRRPGIDFSVNSTDVTLFCNIINIILLR